MTESDKCMKKCDCFRDYITNLISREAIFSLMEYVVHSREISTVESVTPPEGHTTTHNTLTWELELGSFSEVKCRCCILSYF